MKNDWVWRKVFERYITILNVLVDIIGVLFFQLVSIIEKLDSKFESFSTEKLKILNNTLIRYVHLFILNYPLQYAKRLVTYLQGKQQGRCVVWIISWALQIHSNTGVPHGTNQLVQKGWIEADDTALQKIYEIWYSFCILGKSSARPFEVKQLHFHRFCS